MGYGTKKRDYSASGKPKREQRLVCTLSEEEEQIIDRYLEKHKITNKSR